MTKIGDIFDEIIRAENLITSDKVILKIIERYLKGFNKLSKQREEKILTYLFENLKKKRQFNGEKLSDKEYFKKTNYFRCKWCNSETKNSNCLCDKVCSHDYQILKQVDKKLKIRE